MTPACPLLLALFLGASFGQTQGDDARALLLQGRALQRRGGGNDPAAAAALFRRGLALEPGSGELHLRLSEALLESGDLEGAVGPARRAAVLAPRSADAWAHLGILQSFRGRKDPQALEEAQQSLRRAAQLMPSDPELWARLAEVAENRRDSDAALKAWLRVGRLRPPFAIQGRSLETLAWERAATLAARTQSYEARREALMALCQAPQPEQAHLRQLEELAREQVEKGFLGHAEESFARLGSHFADEPALWENVALLQVRSQRYEEALATLQRAESLRISTRTQFHTGLCLMNLGRFAEAIPRWRQVQESPELQKDPQFLEQARLLLATALLLNGQPKALLEQGDSSLQGQLSPGLQALRIQAFVRLQTWTEAGEALRAALAAPVRSGLVRMLPGSLSAELQKGGALDRSARRELQRLEREATASLWAEFRQWQPCLDTLDALRADGPLRSIDPLLLASSALQELGRPAEALNLLREAQRLNPSHPTLQNNLGYLLLELDQDLPEASTLIAAALKQEPDNPSTLDSWGWALFKQKRYAEAEPVLRRAAGLQPLNPEVLKHFGEALLHLDRKAEALDQWERALAFAFPERKALERRVQQLRADLARQQPSEEPEPEPDPETTDEGEERR